MNYKIYFSDPTHSKSVIGRWLWVYRGKGAIKVGKDAMNITCGPLGVRFTQSMIKSLDIGCFPRTAKPLPLHYIDICYEEDGHLKNIFVVPAILHRSVWFTSNWAMNRNTVKCLNELKQWAGLVEQDAAPTH